MVADGDADSIGTQAAIAVGERLQVVAADVMVFDRAITPVNRDGIGRYAASKPSAPFCRQLA